MPYEKDINIAQYECDLNNRMALGAILRQVQQISTDHCDSEGAVTEVFDAGNVAFLLAKLSVEINKDITVRDNIHIITSPTAPQKATFHRFTKGLLNGELAFTVDARWILVDKTSHKILRTAPEEILLPFDDGEPTVHNIRIKKGEAEPAGKITATYSRVDINKHMNNTQYADCILDALPMDEVSSRRISKFIIHYHQEIAFGESATIAIAKLDNDTYYVCGRKQEIKYFEAQVIFA